MNLINRTGGPPFKHEDLRPRLTKIGFGGMVVAILPGPLMVLAGSAYLNQQKKDGQ